MEPSSAGQGKWRRQSERRTPNCRSDKTTIQRNDVPRGTMDETSSLWTLVSIALPRSVREVRLFRLFLLIPCWESQRLIPKRSAGPRATKIGVVSLTALDHHRPNREAPYGIYATTGRSNFPSKLVSCRNCSSMLVFGEPMRWMACIAAPILLADVGDICCELVDVGPTYRPWYIERL